MSLNLFFVFRFGQQRCQREAEVQRTEATPSGTSVRVPEREAFPAGPGEGVLD